MKKYDYVVVLAGEIIQKDDGYEMPEFFDNLAQGTKMRLDAAVKMFNDGSASNIIVVGGPVRDSNDEKPDIMAEYLIKENIPEEEIIKIPSEANTQGNATAVNEFINKNTIVGKIGLLTSFYHLPRAMKFFIGQDLRCEPIAVEAILLDHPDYGQQKIRQFYSSPEMLNRFDQEIEGLDKIEKEQYKTLN